MVDMTRKLLLSARQKVAEGNLDVVDAIIKSAIEQRVNQGFAWDARDQVVRVAYPGEKNEHVKDNGVRVSLHLWCRRQKRETIIAALNSILDT